MKSQSLSKNLSYKSSMRSSAYCRMQKQTMMGSSWSTLGLTASICVQIIVQVI